jgi:hypothetical protein
MMKKTFLSIAALLALSASADAQFYYRVGIGYAFPHAGQSIAGQEWPYSGSVSNSVAFNISGASFSAGLQGGIALGYNFSRNVGVQLDAQAGLSAKTYDFNINNITVSGVASNVTISQHAKFPVNLIPSIVVRTGGDPWDIYCRMGVALPVSSNIEKQNTITNLPGTGAMTTSIETWQVHSSFSAGFAAAAGFEYKMGSTSVWAEVSLLSMSLYIKQAELTAYNYNGQNIPLNQISGTLNVTYKKNVNVDSAGTLQPAYTQPFSNVGIMVGIRQSFGEPRRKHVEEEDDNKGYYRRHGNR